MLLEIVNTIASHRPSQVDGREQEDSDESRQRKIRTDSAESRQRKIRTDSAESYAACSSGMTATERSKPPLPVLKEDGKLSVLDSSVHDVDRYTLKLYRINGRKNKRTF
jgi:hypothetical protein